MLCQHGRIYIQILPFRTEALISVAFPLAQAPGILGANSSQLKHF